MRPKWQEGLSGAGGAKMGGARSGSFNRCLMSERARRRAFEKEARVLIRAFTQRYPDFQKPERPEDREAACAAHSGFRLFCAKLDALAACYGQ